MSHYTLEVIRFTKSGKFYDVIPITISNSVAFHQITDQIERHVANLGAYPAFTKEFDYLVTGKMFKEAAFEGMDFPNGYPIFVKVVSSLPRLEGNNLILESALRTCYNAAGGSLGYNLSNQQKQKE